MPSTTTAAGRRSSAVEIEDDDEATANLREAAGSPSKGGRVRSLSATLGDLFTVGSSSSAAAAAKRQRVGRRESILELEGEGEGEERT